MTEGSKQLSEFWMW